MVSAIADCLRTNSLGPWHLRSMSSNMVELVEKSSLVQMLPIITDLVHLKCVSNRLEMLLEEGHYDLEHER